MTYHKTIRPALMPPTYRHRKTKVQFIWSIFFESPATEVKTRYPAINAGDMEHACGATRFAPGDNSFVGSSFSINGKQPFPQFY